MAQPRKLLSQKKSASKALSDDESSSDVESASDIESDDETDVTDVTATPKLQWSKPGALSLLVGVSASILRSWADSGVVQTIVSAGGHRLFNVQSVRQHIETSAIEAAEQANQRIKRAEENTRVLVFVKLQSSAEMLRFGTGIANSVPLSVTVAAATQNMKQRILNNFALVHSECEKLRASDIIIALPSADNSRAVGHGPPVSDNLPNRPDLLRLFQTLQRHGRTKVVLQAPADISSVPSTYSLFECICKCLRAEIEIVPSLCA